jgi:CheY-like chemotaxis protein
LFVDDEPSMLRVLKMGMRSMAADWDMEFAASGEEALALIGQKKFDVVVTDMRMPGINGAQLLNHVLRHHPETIRIILSGYSDLSEVVNCVGLTHQFLEKPCSLDDLKNCLKRVTWSSPARQRKTRELTAGLKNLPSLPELYLEIADALQSPTASAQRIAEIAVQRSGALRQIIAAFQLRVFWFQPQGVFRGRSRAAARRERHSIAGDGRADFLLVLPAKMPELSPLTRFGITRPRPACWAGGFSASIWTTRIWPNRPFAPASCTTSAKSFSPTACRMNIPPCCANPATGTPLFEIERKAFSRHPRRSRRLSAGALGAAHPARRSRRLPPSSAPLRHARTLPRRRRPHRQRPATFPGQPSRIVPSPVDADYLKHVQAGHSNSKSGARNCLAVFGPTRHSESACQKKFFRRSLRG